MSALGTGATCCGEREGCEVSDCELASITVVDPAPIQTVEPADIDDEEDDDE